jgi:hypothetical protein
MMLCLRIVRRPNPRGPLESGDRLVSEHEQDGPDAALERSRPPKLSWRVTGTWACRHASTARIGRRQLHLDFWG